MSKTLNISDLKMGDIVCLDAYPYKPMKVLYCVDGNVRLRELGGVASKSFTDAEFDKAGYIFAVTMTTERP